MTIYLITFSDVMYLTEVPLIEPSQSTPDFRYFRLEEPQKSFSMKSNEIIGPVFMKAVFDVSNNTICHMTNYQAKIS
jgi:hypothetical protein